jgi:hypothetical protein
VPTASPKSNRLPRRLLQLGGLLLLLLALLVLANSLFDDEENPLNPIAAAAEHTQSEPGVRYTMVATYTSDSLPKPTVAHGWGAYDTETDLSKATLKLTSPSGEPITLELVGDSTSFYLRGDKIIADLPGGKEWMKIEPFLGHSQQEAMVGNASVSSSLEMLSSVGGDVQQLGQEKVRGVTTERYRARYSLSDYSELLREEGKDDLAEQYEKWYALNPSSPLVEAWIDAKDVLRRFRMVMTLPTEPGKPSMTTEMTMDFFDFGARPQIVLPDSDRVFDATPIFEQELDAAED